MGPVVFFDHRIPRDRERWTCPVSVDSFLSSLLGDLCLYLPPFGDLTTQGGLAPQASEAPGSFLAISRAREPVRN